ncbi:MAG: hypothetical protein HZB51_34160 [Chloroflexi bacterium]|nr:hypothetical protein [Chloroflexota bacterium]
MSDKIYNLNELMGGSEPVRVSYDDKVYELTRPASFSPLQDFKYAKLIAEYRRTALKLEGKSKANLSDEKVAELFEQLVDKMLLVLCPESDIATLPFNLKLKAIDLYNKETADKPSAKDANAQGTKKKRSRRTGVASSHG